MWGVSQLHTVANYKKHDSKKLLKTFAYMYSECLKAGGIIHITADEDSLKKLRPLIESFAKKAGITKLLPAHSYTMEELKPYIWQYEDAASDEIQLLQVSGQTGYAAAITPASDYLTKEASAENIFASWLSSHTLWDKIRTTGGAYGASCWIDSIEKQALMTTYRDPSPGKSLQVYLDSLKELCSRPIPKEEVEKSIVSAYGNAIVPACPKDRGARSFEGMLYGNPQNFKQKRVDNILEVSEDDVEKAADRLYEAAVKKCSKAVFCSKSDITEKSENFAGNIIKIPL
jgi:Zn-dependent M16 (insulinase) family peptidase